MKSISNTALALGIALSWPAHALVIDNGFPEGTPGRFSVDIQTGGAVSRAVYTTRRFDSPIIDTVSLVSQYQIFVDPGNDGEGFFLSGTQPSTSPFDQSISSIGSFEGENGTVNWSVSSKIVGNPTRLSTSVFFSGENSGPPDFVSEPIGPLRVMRYLDADVSDGGDVLRMTGPVLETLGNRRLVGLAQSVSSFMFPPITVEGAADVFNLILPRIAGDGQPVSTDITIARLPPFSHPDLGGVRGPGDVVSLLAFDSGPERTFVFAETALTPVPPPGDPVPPRDSDGDGVVNPSDFCPSTPAGVPVSANGCPIPDSDADGVIDTLDDCPRTPPGTEVRTNGCALADLDFDGVADNLDNCIVVSNPDQSDVDGDGVGDVCDVTNPVPRIVNRKSVPCRGKQKQCNVKLACPARQNSLCKNTAIITVERKFLRASFFKSSASGRAGTITMATGATAIGAGVVGVIKMKLNRNGRLVIGANRREKVTGMMRIFNSAGERLSSTPIIMRIK